MKFFLDTEFIERGPKFPVTLVSIGMVSEEGESFYAISSEFDPETASQWVKDNVLSHLGNYPKTPLATLAEDLELFIQNNSEGEKPEFWGYYADYDWVVTAQIFGTMMDLPKGWPMYCRDIKQLCDDKGNPKLPEQGKGEHNALADARWNLRVYRFLEVL